MLEEQKIYLHNAFTDLVKMGVKYGEVMAHGEVDKKTKEVETYGKVSGLFKAEWEEIKKVTKDFPAIRSATDIAKTFLSDDSMKMKVAEVLSTLVIPGGVSGYARSRDENVSGESIKRIAKDWQDVFKLKIPGFRETVKSQFDLIQEKRMHETAVEELETKIKKEKEKPFYSRDAVKKMREEQKKIAAEIKQKNLDKFIESEEAYYELCKEFGVTPIGKKNLSKKKEKVESEIFKGRADRLKLPKKD
jgi:predicted transcriptional regulator